ncbi:MAG: choloylglycine hydrolase [Lachnospiraceae bacterium]
MCTAITFQGESFYFGRTLDVTCGYRETVAVTPRNFPFQFRFAVPMQSHYAVIGMATVAEGTPLYYDAMNEKGLCMAGLRFPLYAAYQKHGAEKNNIAPFELIPWILGQCDTVSAARELLCRTCLVQEEFSAELPSEPLHWMLADETACIVLEIEADGMHLYENPVGVLTNSPTFPMQMSRLTDFMQLSREEPRNMLLPHVDLQIYSRGMGAVGLPGDWSSASRFIRAAFVRGNALPFGSEDSDVGQFFHILDTVGQIYGCVRVGEEGFEQTVYTSCCNASKGIYYYTMYGNRAITGVDMHKADLDSDSVQLFPLQTAEEIRMLN